MASVHQSPVLFLKLITLFQEYFVAEIKISSQISRCAGIPINAHIVTTDGSRSREALYLRVPHV